MVPIQAYTFVLAQVSMFQDTTQSLSLIHKTKTILFCNMEPIQAYTSVFSGIYVSRHTSTILQYQCQSGHDFICISSQTISFDKRDSGCFSFSNQEVIALTL